MRQMPNMRVEELGQTPDPVEGYEGHASIGFDCLRCGVHLKPAAKWRSLHDAWHARHGE